MGWDVEGLEGVFCAGAKILATGGAARIRGIAEDGVGEVGAGRETGTLEAAEDGKRK